jgi:hypothetical protein
VGPKWITRKKHVKHKESPAVWDSGKGPCTEAPQTGAARQDPVELRARKIPLTGEEHLSSSSPISENLEGLTERVGTLSLQVTRKNCCAAAYKRARKAKLAGAPIGDSGGGQPWSALGGHTQTLQKPGTSGAHCGRELPSVGLESPECKGQMQGPNK